jgi:putative transposase
MRFVLRLKDGESMASLCREFGISRVTGYKIYERYEECGLKGLTDRARTPTATPISFPPRSKQ